jgi:hypothetical protein
VGAAHARIALRVAATYTNATGAHMHGTIIVARALELLAHIVHIAIAAARHAAPCA